MQSTPVPLRMLSITCASSFVKELVSIRRAMVRSLQRTGNLMWLCGENLLMPARQVIGFGQCKTGTNWTLDLMKLRPDDFFSKWVRQHPTVLPVRLYFITDRVIEQWYDHSKDGGVLLDRCRIMEYCTDIPVALMKSIKAWVTAAASKHKLQIS